MTDARRELLIQVAWLYYDRRLTQQQVSRRMGISRSSVSRALAQAEAEGIVRIELCESPAGSVQLGEQLVRRYGLRGAHVGVQLPDEPPREIAATAMARRLETLCANGATTIATGWGRTIARAAQLVRPRQTSGLRFVDAVGHATTEVIAPAVEVSRSLARAFGADVVHMPSPALANPVAAEAIRDTHEVQRALTLARSADALVVAVGVVGDQSLLVREDVLSSRTMRQVVQDGAVGEMLGCYYDTAGVPVSASDRVAIGLSLEDVRSATLTIACAGGAEKAPAVRAAITGGYVDEVIVDDALAHELLA